MSGGTQSYLKRKKQFSTFFKHVTGNANLKKTAAFIIFMLLLTSAESAVRDSVSSQEKSIRLSIVMTANTCLGIRYMFNGTTPAGFDTSGFTQYVYYKNNIDLPRTVEDQYRTGKNIRPAQAKPGDLIFFFQDPDKRMIIDHVGIYLGKDKFIHMPGEGQMVRIDRISKGSAFSRRFAGVKSYRHIFTVPAEAPKTETESERREAPQAEERSDMFEAEDY